MDGYNLAYYQQRYPELWALLASASSISDLNQLLRRVRGAYEAGTLRVAASDAAIILLARDQRHWLTSRERRAS